MLQNSPFIHFTKQEKSALRYIKKIIEKYNIKYIKLTKTTTFYFRNDGVMRYINDEAISKNNKKRKKLFDSTKNQSKKSKILNEESENDDENGLTFADNNDMEIDRNKLLEVNKDQNEGEIFIRGDNETEEGNSECDRNEESESINESVSVEDNDMEIDSEKRLEEIFGDDEPELDITDNIGEGENFSGKVDEVNEVGKERETDSLDNNGIEEVVANLHNGENRNRGVVTVIGKDDDKGDEVNKVGKERETNSLDDNGIEEVVANSHNGQNRNMVEAEISLNGGIVIETAGRGVENVFSFDYDFANDFDFHNYGESSNYYMQNLNIYDFNLDYMSNISYLFDGLEVNNSALLDKDDEVNKVGDVLDVNNESQVSKEQIKEKDLKDSILTLENADYRKKGNLVFKDNCNFSNFIENCITAEMQLEFFNCELLEYYYGVGAFLNEIWESVKGELSGLHENSIVSGMLKGTGIAKSFMIKYGEYNDNIKAKARRFYKISTRVYEVYKCFEPNAIPQIYRAQGVSGDKLIRVGGKKEFAEFVVDINNEVVRNYNLYKIENYSYIPSNSFETIVISEEIKSNVKKFAKNPSLSFI